MTVMRQVTDRSTGQRSAAHFGDAHGRLAAVGMTDALLGAGPVVGEVVLAGDGFHLGAVLDRVWPVTGRHHRLDEDRRRGARREHDAGIVATELAGAVRSTFPWRDRAEARRCRRATRIGVGDRQRPVIEDAAVVDDVDHEGADTICRADRGAGTLLQDQIDLLFHRRPAVAVPVATPADWDRGAAAAKARRHAATRYLLIIAGTAFAGMPDFDVADMAFHLGALRNSRQSRRTTRRKAARWPA